MNHHCTTINKMKIMQPEKKSDFVSRIINFRESIQPFLEQAYNILSSIGNALTKIGDFYYRHFLSYNKFYWILMQLEWPPPPNLIEKGTEYLKIVEEYEKYGLDFVKDKVESIMLNWYTDQNLIEMIKKWRMSPLLKPRIHILESAVHAHIRNEYILSIPVFLSQIEGIITSGFRFSGWMNSKKFKEHLESVLHEALVIKNKNESIREFVINVLMVTFIHGENIESSLSRHAILHGADTDYGTRTNSLKLILLIENIKNLFRFESIENSKIFHFYGCPALNSSTRKRSFYSNVQEARRAGLTGCRRCNADNIFW